jgi:CRP-like cAMP-binding protein
MNDAKQLLCRSPLFEGADNPIIEKFMAQAELVRFVAGEIPVAETTVTDSIYLIVEGELRISVELEASDAPLKVLSALPGTFVGLVNFFDEVAQPCTVRAQTDVTALVWKAEDWRRLAKANPAFGYELARRIGRELVARMSNWINNLLDTVNWGV